MRGRILVATVVLALSTPAFAAITGTLMNSDGQPVAGAKLALHSLETADARRARLLSDKPERTPLAATASDAQGRFSFESPKEPVVAIQVTADGYAPNAIRVERDEDMGGVLLTRAATKEGRVTANGKPVAGARVLWLSSAEVTATTDNEGRYKVPDPSKWADRVVVLHRDYAIVDEAARRMTASTMNVDRTLQTGLALKGIVVAENGKNPVKGVTITWSGWPVATSGDDGSYTIAHLDPKWERIDARFETASGTRARAGDKGQPMRLVRNGSLTGSLRDARTQAAVAGAEVFVRRGERFDAGVLSSVITDARGNFSIPSLAPGSYQLAPVHPGFNFANTGVSITTGERATRTLLGTQYARVTGSVVNEDRVPVAGASLASESVSRQTGMMVFMGPMMGAQAARISAPDGRFAMRVEPDSDVQIEAKKKGYPNGRSSTLRLASGERRGGVVITVPSGVAVTGRVVDRDGKPVSGASVSAVESRGITAQQVRQIALGAMRRGNEEGLQTGGDGTFTIRLKEGTHDLTFSREGYAQKVVRAQQVNNSTRPMEVTLDPAVEISGRVVRNGTGIAGVRINLVGEGNMDEGETAADGSFRIGNLTPGPTMLNASKEDEFIQQFRPVTAPATDILIEIPPGGRITGRVVDKTTKQPVTAFEAGITAARGGGGMMIMGPPQSRSFTTEDGSFSLDNVPAGATTLVVTAPGYTAARVPNVNVEEGKAVADIEVAMDRGVKVTGKVTGPDGGALTGVAVRVDLASGRMMRMPTPGSNAVTDANGEYVLDAQEPGEKTLVFSRSGYVTATKTATLSGADTRVDAQLSTGMRITGLVVTEGGAPLAEAFVGASSASDPRGASTRTDQNGAFQLEGLAPGRYTFRASKQGYPSAEVRDTDISAGAPVRIVVRAGGTVYGRVTGLTADELASTVVSASGADGNASGPVDSVGNYRIEGTPTGTVRVVARTSQTFAGGKSSPVKSVQVEAGSSVQQDIEFLTGTTVRGRVTRDGRAIAGAMVSFFPRNAQAQTSARTQSDSDGNYEVSGLEDAVYSVGVTDIQRGTPYTTTYEVRGSSTFNIDMKSSPLRGRVVDASTGQPVGEAMIEIRERDTGSGPRFAMRTVQTDAAGAFTFDAVSAGSYHVSAEKDGYGTKVVDVTVNDSPGDVEIKLSSNPGVVLKVVDGRDGKLLSNAIIRATDAQNRVVFESPMRFSAGSDQPAKIWLEPGTYRVLVYAGGYAARTMNISSPSAPQTVALTPGGTIMVRSQGSDRRRARLMGADGREYQRGFGGGVFSIDPSPGLTQLQNIAPGSYTLQILGDRDEVITSTQVNVGEGQSAVVEI